MDGARNWIREQAAHRRVGPIDDGGQGKDGAVGVQNDWVDHRLLYDRHELPQLQIIIQVMLRAQYKPF